MVQVNLLDDEEWAKQHQQSVSALTEFLSSSHSFHHTYQQVRDSRTTVSKSQIMKITLRESGQHLLICNVVALLSAAQV